MAPLYRVGDTKVARNQLANLYLKYRRLRAVSTAEFKIEKALQQNPQGGTPIAGTTKWSITVHPLLATYQIDGDEVTILSYADTHGP